jgi:choline-sulfatase
LNVLILMADQFRADLAGHNGSPVCRTPSLDRLAREGTGFGRAYTTTPLCTPARAALFTGRYPHSHGLVANTQYAESPTPSLPGSEKLLFEHLAAAGYRCGYTGKWHLNVGDEAAEARRRGVTDFYPAGRAAALHRERLGLPPRDDVTRARQRTMAGNNPPMSGVAPFPLEYHQDAGIAGQAIELLRTYVAEGLGTPERPFALVCSFHGPHFPIEPPEPFASMYRPESVPRPASFDDTFDGKPQGQRTHPWLQLASHLSWPEWQRVIAHYWGYATFVDALMGRVLDALHDLDLAGSTVVFATADHGEMAGHHRMFDKGPYPYEDVVRVPYVWRVPGAPARGVDDRLVSHVDALPTLLAVAGVTSIDGTPPLQGHSLAPVLAGEADPADRSAVFAETNTGDTVNPQHDTRMVVSATGHKYVYRPRDPASQNGAGFDELYDLSADSGELRNTIDCENHRPVRDDLRARLAAHMRRTDDPLPAPRAAVSHADGSAMNLTEHTEG